MRTPERFDTTLEDRADEELLRAHLNHVLRSPQFAGAPKLGQFLAFVVETELAGQRDQIKESLIAVEVYGRRPDYNPQIDSTVRVEAGRLRARLRQYYDSAGQGQPFEIELPKGRYVPLFHRRSQVVVDAPSQAGVPPVEEIERVCEASNPVKGRNLQRVLAIVSLSISAVILTLGLHRGIGIANSSRTLPNVKSERAVDATTMQAYLRAYELLRLPVLKEGVVPSVPPTVIESVQLFEEVTRRAPDFARGWVGLAEANEWWYEIDRNHPPERLRAGKAAARRAIDLDPALPEAWTVLTSLLFFREWDIPAAEDACRRAIELNPRDSLAAQRYIDLLRLQGRHSEAARAITLAAGVQPSTPNLRNRKALLLLDTGQLDDALKEAMAAEALNPSKQQMAYSGSIWIQAIVHQRQGRTQVAETLFRKAIDNQAHDLWSEPSLGHLLALTGRKSEAMEILSELRRQLDLGRPRRAAMALIYVGLGRYHEAIDSLERGFIERDTAVLFAGLDSRFASLHSEPRFQALMARIKRTAGGATLMGS